MELRQLRYLTVLAEEEHFTRAAARLHVAQPALSQQIRKLEDEYGVPLVDRTTRRTALTPAGEALVDRARRVLAEVDAAEAELADLRGLKSGRVSIGVTLTPGPLDVAELLATFDRANEGVELAVRPGLSRLLADLLRSDVIDCAFLTTLDPPAARGLELRPVASERLVAVLPRGHRLATRKRIGIGDLRDDRFVQFDQGATIQATLERAAAAAGFEPRSGLEARDVTGIRSIVAAGLAIAVLPRTDAEAPGPDTVAVALREPEFEHEVLLAWRSARRHGPAARAFLELAGAGDVL